MDDEVITITSGDDENGDDEPIELTRRDILHPVITRVIDALGGFEGTSPPIYRLGDSLLPCLSDLKKLWRKDDTDDDRTCAHIFWESRVLPNDLVPILLVLCLGPDGKGRGVGGAEDKRVIAVADLCCAMTWPIDMAEELKELDEEYDKGIDFTQLLHSHLIYKAALLRPGVIQSLFSILLPPLSKPTKERTTRDSQIINLILHLIRNLAFIRDLPRDVRSSADQAELGALQGKLIRQLEETHFLELLLVIAANKDGDPMFNGWNTLVLEIIYLLVRGIRPGALCVDIAKQPTENLHRLLQAEEKTRRDVARKASSRHSRFGTTISVKLNPNKKKKPSPPSPSPNPAPTPVSPPSSQPFILHRQSALTSSAGTILDLRKKSRSKASHARIDDLGTNGGREEDNLGVEARGVLRRFVREVVGGGCFNPFLSALLKDIKSERPKITEKDNLRLLFVTKWFLEFFLTSRAAALGSGEGTAGNGDGGMWGFGLIAEVIERGWIVWVLKRMREAVEEKPKQWTELQAGIECLTQLLLLIDAMSASSPTFAFSSLEDDPSPEAEAEAEAEAALTLRHQLIYNGEVLDIALDSIRSYKEGTQSLAYLDSSVYLGWALFRMLEKWGKGGAGGGGGAGEEMYVRKKKVKRRKRKGVGEAGEGVPDVEDVEVEEEEVVLETMFTFEAFEMKFANSDITRTLLAYLARYKEYESSDNMKRIVSLLHRQAVRAKAEGLFFNVSTLNLFKTILDDQKSLPRDQPHKDLINLINFVLRKFFKALAEEPFLAIEAFFPKNRNQWKQFSSWEPEEKVKGGRGGKMVEDTRFPADVQVKKGYKWSEQLGIAIAALVEGGEGELVNWVKDILTLVIAQRQRLIDEVDVKPVDDDAEDLTQPDPEDAPKQGPSMEAMSKLTDYMIPYISDEQADAATKNPHLKLVFRLISFFILDDDAEELEWYVPAAIMPTELQRSLNVINQFLETPLDLGGKKAKELLSKKTRRRRRARRSPSTSDSDTDEDEPVEKKKREKKKKEKETYKSAQFIEDSDEEYGDMDAFLEKEKQLRDKTTAKAAAQGSGIGTMKATGTKKRRRGKDGKGGGSKKWKGEPDVEVEEQKADSEDSDIGVIGELEGDDTPDVVAEPRPRPRPRPKPRAKNPSNASSPRKGSDAAALLPSSDAETGATEDPPDSEGERDASTVTGQSTKRKTRIVISDDDICSRTSEGSHRSRALMAISTDALLLLDTRYTVRS